MSACEHCGAELSPEMKFCGNCGKSTEPKADEDTPTQTKSGKAGKLVAWIGIPVVLAGIGFALWHFDVVPFGTGGEEETSTAAPAKEELCKLFPFVDMNLRNTPEVEGDENVITQIDEGSPISFYGEDTTDAEGNTWVRVRDGDNEGWIMFRSEEGSYFASTKLYYDIVDAEFTDLKGDLAMPLWVLSFAFEELYDHPFPLPSELDEETLLLPESDWMIDANGEQVGVVRWRASKHNQKGNDADPDYALLLVEKDDPSDKQLLVISKRRGDQVYLAHRERLNGFAYSIERVKKGTDVEINHYSVGYGEITLDQDAIRVWYTGRDTKLLYKWGGRFMLIREQGAGFNPMMEEEEVVEEAPMWEGH